MINKKSIFLCVHDKDSTNSNNPFCLSFFFSLFLTFLILSDISSAFSPQTYWLIFKIGVSLAKK